MKPVDYEISRCADRIANRWFGEDGIPNMVAALNALAQQEIKDLVANVLAEKA